VESSIWGKEAKRRVGSDSRGTFLEEKPKKNLERGRGGGAKVSTNAMKQRKKEGVLWDNEGLKRLKQHDVGDGQSISGGKGGKKRGGSDSAYSEYGRKRVLRKSCGGGDYHYVWRRGSQPGGGRGKPKKSLSPRTLREGSVGESLLKTQQGRCALLHLGSCPSIQKKDFEGGGRRGNRQPEAA